MSSGQAARISAQGRGAPNRIAGGFISRTSRRQVLRATVGLSLLAAGTGTVSGATPVMAAPAGAGGAFDYQHRPVPLPFKAGALKGLSQALVQSHWENNYGGAVKALNTRAGPPGQALDDASTPPYVYSGLKREQLLRTGSVVLHELYFGNLGGNGQAGADLRTKTRRPFGTFDAWEAEFRKIGQVSAAVRAGSSWGSTAGCGWSRTTGWQTTPRDLRTRRRCWSWTCTNTLSRWTMGQRQPYIDAFLANVSWDAVAARMDPPRA